MPRGLISDEKGINKIGEGGGGGCTRQGDFLGPRTQILEKKKRGIFVAFFRARYFFMNAAPTKKSPGGVWTHG